jgi:transketolase
MDAKQLHDLGQQLRADAVHAAAAAGSGHPTSSMSAADLMAVLLAVYSVEPVDTQMLRAATADTGCFVTVEDHWAEGGLGGAVLAAFANGHQAPRITKLAVHAMPGSATPAEQLHAAGIDAKAIEAAARVLAGDRVAS